MFLLAICAIVALFFVYSLLGNPVWIRLMRDQRGQMLSELGIVDRGACSLEPLPTEKWPVYSTTVSTTLDADGNGTITYTAERDTLFLGMSAVIADAVPLSATISMSYCGVKYLINSSARTWTRCCDRKPIFFVRVKEDKKLTFTVNGGTPAGAASITLHGFQGRDCCG